MASKTIPKTSDPKPQKEITLEMPLEELWELQEIRHDVSAFHQVLIWLSESQHDSYDPLLRFFDPIYKRFGDLMVLKTNLDQRIFDAEKEDQHLFRRWS